MRPWFTLSCSLVGLIIGIALFFDSWSFSALVYNALFSAGAGAFLGFGFDSAREGHRKRSFTAFALFIAAVVGILYMHSVIVEYDCFPKDRAMENRFTGACDAGCLLPWYWVPAGEECRASIDERESSIRDLCADLGFENLSDCPAFRR